MAAKSSFCSTVRILKRRYSCGRGRPSSMTTMLPDVVGALQVAHVVALDAQRRLRQVQVVLQGVERPGPGVVVGGPLEAMAGELLPRVPGHHLEQGLLLASLGHPDLDAGDRPGPSGLTLRSTR